MEKTEKKGKEYLKLAVGENLYCFEIEDVQEIISYRKPHQVPCGHKENKNFISLRDSVVEVVDLGIILRNEPSAIGSYIIILNKDSNLRGFIVDKVIEVAQFESEIFTPIEELPVFKKDILDGIFHSNKELISKLSTNFLFA